MKEMSQFAALPADLQQELARALCGAAKWAVRRDIVDRPLRALLLAVLHEDLFTDLFNDRANDADIEALARAGLLEIPEHPDNAARRAEERHRERRDAPAARRARDEGVD